MISFLPSTLKTVGAASPRQCGHVGQNTLPGTPGRAALPARRCAGAGRTLGMSKPRVSVMSSASVRKVDLSSLTLEQLRTTLESAETSEREVREGRLDHLWENDPEVEQKKAEFLTGLADTLENLRDEIRRRTAN